MNQPTGINIANISPAIHTLLKIPKRLVVYVENAAVVELAFSVKMDVMDLSIHIIYPSLTDNHFNLLPLISTPCCPSSSKGPNSARNAYWFICHTIIKITNSIRYKVGKRSGEET